MHLKVFLILNDIFYIKLQWIDLVKFLLKAVPSLNLLSSSERKASAWKDAQLCIYKA